MAQSLLLSGSSHPKFAEALSRASGLTIGQTQSTLFPDGEFDVMLEADVRDTNVYIVQTLSNPVGENLMELALLADCCKRRGARQVNAIVPYLGYARHDRRESPKEPLGARVLAELIAATHVDKLVCVDIHSRAIEGCFPQPVEHVSAIPLLANALLKVPTPRVVVSPDVGAIKRAEAFAKILECEVALVHKHRLSGSDVETAGIIGNVKGKHAIIVDDMIATAGTLAAASKEALSHGALPRLTIAATHGLFVGSAFARLKDLPIEKIVVTNSLVEKPAPVPLEYVDVAPLIAQAILAR